MMSEVEITVRVMTPREGREPLYTAEKIIEKGDLEIDGTRFSILRSAATLIERAANAVRLDQLDPAELRRLADLEQAQADARLNQARARDAVEWERDNRP